MQASKSTWIEMKMFSINPPEKVSIEDIMAAASQTVCSFVSCSACSSDSAPGDRVRPGEALQQRGGDAQEEPLPRQHGPLGAFN